MNLTLARFHSSRMGTAGVLASLETPPVYTLEDMQREGPKVPGSTCIPGGRYELKLRREGGFHTRYAARFGSMHRGMLWLQDVPGFTYVLIHCGNTIEDTAGCVLVGDLVVHENGRLRLLDSAATYARVYPPIAAKIEKGERVELEVRG